MESSILCASGPELSILATTIAIYIGELFDVNDLGTIANFLNILGDSVALLANQKNRCQNSLKNNTNSFIISRNNSATTT